MDELKNYVQKTTRDKIILGVFSGVFAVAACILLINQNWVLFGIIAFCAVALCVGAVTSSSNDNKFFEAIENSPEKDAILSDFAAAESVADDKIRMGDKYIFSKKNARLIRYEEIASIKYFEHHDRETGRIEPGLAVELTDGSKSTLCDLYESDAGVQVKKIADIIVSKNPSADFYGY